MRKNVIGLTLCALLYTVCFPALAQHFGFGWRGVSAFLRRLDFGSRHVSARLKVLWARGSGERNVTTAAQ